MLDVCLPGTGGMMPLPDRWLTCCWMEYQGRAALIDCGEGTQIALRQAGRHMGRLDALFLTHFHADHVAGLPGLLLTVGNCGKTSPLRIYGPAGAAGIVSALLVVAPLPYPVEAYELGSGDEVPLWEGMAARCAMLAHNTPCLGYRIEVRRKPVFNPEKARELGVPVAFYRRLHAGESALLPDGRTIGPEQVLDGERAPLSVCYCTDTLPVEAVSRLAAGADLMIGEGMYGDDALEAKARQKRHSLFSQTARLAARAGARRLWLTHYSPSLTDPQEWIGAAREHFPGAVAGRDGMCLTL